MRIESYEMACLAVPKDFEEGQRILYRDEYGMDWTGVVLGEQQRQEMHRLGVPEDYHRVAIRLDAGDAIAYPLANRVWHAANEG